MPLNIPENHTTCHRSAIDDKYRAWIVALREYAIQHRHRAAVVISGAPNDCCSFAGDLLNAASIEHPIYLSDIIPGALKPKQATTQLGKEYEAIVFDMHSGFDPDAFGAICGTLVGGGLLLLLMPDQKNWVELISSRYLKRILKIINEDASVYWLEAGKAPPEINFVSAANAQRVAVIAPFRTDEQRTVVEAIEIMALAEVHASVVLMSDRGRGKSAALGLAAGRLMQKGLKRVVVTAPRMSISEPVFRHAQQIYQEAELHHGRLVHQDKELIFMAPDALIDDVQQADLLLVDEAASIPLPMLEDLLENYPSIIFATTVHGYEGTGRGFALKFDKILDRLRPGWQRFNMNTPVRWAEHDPVETLVDQLLCLDAELVNVSGVNTVDKSKCRVVLRDRDILMYEHNRLSSIFALLVNAHYRTRPSDLLYMLDSPSVRIYTLEYQRQILAAVLINEEGGFDAELSRLIYLGQRRPSGHLLAQTLSLHGGCETASTLSYSRIMRIAVHPELQGQGLGSLLLEQVVLREKSRPVDAVGTSFGATLDLVRFWQRAGFAMVRLGFSRDHSSGTNSAVMLLPLTIAGDRVFQEVQSRFQRYLPVWIDEVYKNMSAEMLSYLDNIKRTDNLEMTNDDWKDVSSFACSHRGYESCMWSLHKLVIRYSNVITTLAQDQQSVIDARILKKMDWPETVKIIAASGKADAIRRLRQAIKTLLVKIEKL